MPAATLTSRAPLRARGSKRLLALAGDERLVEYIRRGNELAFEVAFERHGTGILAFCRHMLGSLEEAEDAVQHTFAAAFKDLQRPGERRIALKAWLYTIARNRCVSVLRARREQAAELHDVPTDGLSEQVEQRAELRELLADVRDLPDDQRAALLLAEAAGLSHAEVAEVLGCEVGSVKGLVFRARSSLMERRAARETPCEDIREQLATLRGGALRRNEIRHHVRRCPGCSAYRDEVRRQREMLAAALPVAPSLGLKGSVMAASGITGAAMGGASAGGLALGSAAAAKVALVGVLAGGTVVAGEVAVQQAAVRDGAVEIAPAPKVHHQGAAAPAAAHRPAPAETGGPRAGDVADRRGHGERAAERRATHPERDGHAGANAPAKEPHPATQGARETSRGDDSAHEAEPRPERPVKPVEPSESPPDRTASPSAALPDATAETTVPLPDTAPAQAPNVVAPAQQPDESQ